jgi:predicted membrane metal-binding protein
MMKIHLRLQATVGQLTTRVNQAQGQVAAANVLARQAQAAAHGAAKITVDRFRPAAPPKYGDKKKGEHVGHWIPIIGDYLRSAPDADYIRLASSYLEGGLRALWTNVYEAYKRANGGNEPPNPRQFFRQTLEANYGLRHLDQKVPGHLEQSEDGS